MIDIINDTPELRAEIDAHNQNAIRLHLPTAPVTWIDMKVESPNGKVVHEHREKANSWNRNYYNKVASTLLPAFMSGTFGAGALSLKDVNGVTKSSTTGDAGVGVSFTRFSSSWKGGSNDTTYGIVVGTGTAAESFEDYKLQTLILTGTGAGQLSYQLGAVGTASYNSGTKKWTQTITRIFNNNSAGSITVNETGLYISPYYDTSTNCDACIERNKLAVGVAVPAAYKLTVTYTTEITFPA